jgi:hypothetical protein
LEDDQQDSKQEVDAEGDEGEHLGADVALCAVVIPRCGCSSTERALCFCPAQPAEDGGKAAALTGYHTLTDVSLPPVVVPLGHVVGVRLVFTSSRKPA